MKVKVRKHKKMPAPVVVEQAERSLVELIQGFLKSESFTFKSEATVRPEKLSDLYGGTNAKN